MCTHICEIDVKLYTAIYKKSPLGCAFPGSRFPGARESQTFSIPEFPGMKLTQFLGTCCKAICVLQRLNDSYLIAAQCGREGHGSRERDCHAWVSESSRGRGVATRLVSDCGSRLSRAAGLLCAGVTLATL